jgi:hypothetical protein
MQQPSDSPPSSSGSPTRSAPAELVREAGLAIGAILGISTIGELAKAGRIDGTHALVGICVIVVPGLASLVVRPIADRVSRPPPR